jgi:hypothetical protein
MPVSPLVVFAFFTAAVMLLVGLRYRRPRTVSLTTFVVLVVTGGVAGFLNAPELPTAIAGAAVVLAILAAWWLAARAGVIAWKRDAKAAPLILQPPFLGTWIVGAGGPLPGRNHHLVASDQRFAYDFVRIGGRSAGTPILAPCDGEVVAASDGMQDLPPSRNPNRPGIGGRELGNHVGIRCGDATVFLCHLQHGSVAVAIGDRIAAGTPVGRCGNSGRTTWPHLHLHAQDLPHYAFREARGVPVAFAANGAPPRVLGFRSRLTGAPAPEPIAPGL